MSTTTIEPALPARAPLPRLFYLDLVRAVAAVLIVITHYNNPYFMQGNYVLSIAPFNIYIGDLGVSLFLIISGAALMLTYGDRIDLKSFYWKRFKGIYPMFWIAWVIATGFFILARNGMPINNGPTWSFVFTLFGVDGMAANFHLPTMYLLGEWFLGFIIIFYLVFPVLRWGVVKHPRITLAVIAVLYLATLWFFQTPRSFPSSIILTARLPELAFGMYLAHYWKRLPFWTLAPAVFSLALWAYYPPTMNDRIATTVVGISAFTVLVVIARFLEAKPIRTVVSFIALYSYAIFLVHHVVIMQIFIMIDPSGFSRSQSYGVFAATCLVILGLSVALFRLESNIVKFTTKAFDGVRIGRR